jgi:hypothetical protein
MEQELISKKELLARYGISYGALYRWKRMQLIPEAWFLHRATPTGQETFFPRELICARVEEILRGKDDSSLEEMARRFGAAEADDARLVVRTRYGESSFPASDLLAVSVRCGGAEEDLLHIIKEITEKRNGHE